jgi:hypothetical protein
LSGSSRKCSDLLGAAGRWSWPGRRGAARASSRGTSGPWSRCTDPRSQISSVAQEQNMVNQG